MARHKKFSGGTKITDFEPLGFELNGEEFTCHAAIPGAVMIDFIRRADSDSMGNSAEALFSFLKSSMDESEYERFNKLINDPEVIIDISLIGEIVSYLIEEYGERPTKGQENS